MCLNWNADKLLYKLKLQNNLQLELKNHKTESILQWLIPEVLKKIQTQWTSSIHSDPKFLALNEAIVEQKKIDWTNFCAWTWKVV